MILISKSYSIITPESAADGDFAECGLDFENCAYSFRELVNELQNYSEVSCRPARGEAFEWVTSEGDTDYRIGEVTEYSLHYSRANPARNAKYWRLAMKAAGFIKGSQS